MLFYLIPTAGDQPSKLEPTQDAARATCKARGLKFNADEMKHDVPTEKAALLEYVNALLAQRYAAAAEGVDTFYRGMDAGAAKAANNDDDVDVARHGDWNGEAPDGHANSRCAFTSTQVRAAALPRSEKVQDVCHLVSKMTAGELGFVALEVIARGARLGGLAA